MHDVRCANQPRAEIFTNTLVTEADAQQRNVLMKMINHFHHHTGLDRRFGSRGKNNR